MKHYLTDQYRKLLIRLQIPMLYARLVVWWETRASLREYLKACRGFVEGRRIALRNAVFGATMIVVTKQVQSRQELSEMSPEEIMRAWRAGRLDYMMHTDEHHPIGRYGDMAFRNWVASGGQLHDFNPSTYRRHRHG